MRRTLAVLFLSVIAACAAPDEEGAPGAGYDGDVSSDIEIGEIGGMCGGIAGFQCKADNTYCKSEPGICVNTADYAGVCTIKPGVCTMQYDPVCGCDGKTYGNSCSAAGAGVSIAYEGECAEE